MYETLALIAKYAMAVVIYIFIFRIVKLIYTDIRAINAGESAVALLPHLKLLTPVTGTNGAAVADMYPLVRDTTVIGRSSKCHITFPDPFISSEHLRIDRMKDTFYASDMGSANGTLLNGNRLDKQVQLRSGDRISLGKIDLIFSEGGR